MCAYGSLALSSPACRLTIDKENKELNLKARKNPWELVNFLKWK